jgi:hypothetical protein
MTADYTAALAGLAGIALLLSAMVVFVLLRPSDLAQQSR